MSATMLAGRVGARPSTAPVHAHAEYWAMEGGRLRTFLAARERLDAVRSAAAKPPKAAAGYGPVSMGYTVAAGVGVISITGPILKNGDWLLDYYGVDYTSAVATGEALAAALADPAVKTILLVIDSPGGKVSGVQELADAVFAARARKPILAYASDLAESGAFWIGCQAQWFGANETAMIGSIGVYGVLRDLSAMGEKIGVKTIVVSSGPHKGVGVPGAPVTAEQLAPMQEIVDDLAGSFVAAVARGRGMGQPAVAALATGRVWVAPKAARLGLIDAVTNLDGALALARAAAVPGEGKAAHARRPSATAATATPPKLAARASSTPAIDTAADVVAAYGARIKSLLASGDPRPERTIAVKFPGLHRAYLEAVNPGKTIPGR